MNPKCPLFHNPEVMCRVKEGSRHRWIGTEQVWYIRNYCEQEYHVDCEDFEAYLEQQAIIKGKILVIDDEQVWLETLNNFFTNRGYQMLTAGSAEEALEIIRKERPVLALIDIKLPGMNGIELLKQAKQEFPFMKNFVITAYDEENKKTVEDIGCDAFFAKPVGLAQLKKQVVHVLAANERRVNTFVKGKVLQGVPKARLLFVVEVLPNEEDRLSAYLRDCFSDRTQCGGEYAVEFSHSMPQTMDKLMSFKPDLVLINFDTLYEIQCGQLAGRIVESPYRPKEVIVYGLNLEAEDKEEIEHLGIQYVDQRRTFAKLITTVKQIALRHGLHSEQA
jgi:two-component system response regulator (stage 0 sporulation protein F)